MDTAARALTRARAIRRAARTLDVEPLEHLRGGGILRDAFLDDSTKVAPVDAVLAHADGLLYQGLRVCDRGVAVERTECDDQPAVARTRNTSAAEQRGCTPQRSSPCALRHAAGSSLADMLVD
jgi:hypothetical protein